MIEKLFNKEDEAPKEEEPLKNKPQRLATIVDTEEPLEAFPEEEQI